MTPDVIQGSEMVERVSIKETWRQMEHCRENKLTRSIGVMNCPVVMFLEILTFCHHKPALNCLEMHPYFTQDEATEFYKKLKVPIAAFAPISPSINVKFLPQHQTELVKSLDLLSEKVVLDLAKKYKKTPAQIVLNWHMRQEHIVCPGMRL